MLLLNFFCLKILVMIWFLQKVFCVEVTWVCMEKQKSSRSGFAKKQCSPPSRDVWHEVPHPKILELSVCALWKFQSSVYSSSEETYTLALCHKISTWHKIWLVWQFREHWGCWKQATNCSYLAIRMWLL
jgi:hypothetical protein